MKYNYFLVEKEDAEKVSFMIPEWILARKGTEYVGCSDENGKISGALAYELNGMSAELLYVCTLPYKRGQGIATGLVDYFIEYIDSMELPVRLEMTWEKDDDPVMREILKEHTEIFVNEDPCIARLSYEVMKNSEVCRKIRERTGNVVPISGLNPIEYREYLSLLEKKELRELVPESSTLVDELCLCIRGVRDENGVCEPKALVYFEQPDENTLRLSFMYVAPKDAVAFSMLLGEVLRRIEQNYQGMDVEMVMLYDQAKKLVDNMFGNEAEIKPLYRAVRF